MQLSAVTGKALAVRPTLPTRLVPSLTKPRMVLSHAYVPYGPSESMEEEPVAPLTRRVTQEAALKRDYLTHTISGEHEFAVFFLVSMGFMMAPVMFPGLVLVFSAIHEQAPWLWGCML